MFFLGVVIIGLITLRLLPIEMMPNTSFGQITINIDIRGGMPAPEVEKRIAKPVEEAVGTVSNLRNLLTISKESNAMIVLEFEPNTNMDFAALEVREKFNRIRNKLPSQIEKPVIAKYEYSDVPIMILAVTSPLKTPEELRKIVDDKIRDNIQRIEGVGLAEVAGGREEKILVEVDQNKLRAYSLSIKSVVNTININNNNLLAGEIKRRRDKILVRVIGDFKTLKEIGNLPIINTSQNSAVRIKDIAVIKDSYLDPVSLARVNGRAAVSIYVQKESLANTLKVAQRIKKALEEIRPKLDKDIKITPIFNQAEYIRKSIKRVKLSLLYGSILATLALLIFLQDIGSVFIIAITIPLSILFTFSLMFLTKVTLNVITLSGLALGVGMLLDTSVVVLENIFKKREQDKTISPLQAALQGTNEMTLAIIASTITTLIVFTPLLFISPEIRNIYSGIALTITFSLLASLLISLTLVPMLASRLKIKRKTPALRPQPTPASPLPVTNQESQNIEDPGQLSQAEKLAVSFKENLQRFFKSFIKICLKLRYVIFLAVALLSLLGFWQGKKLGKEFIGIAEHNKFTIFVEMPTGTKLEVTDRVVKEVEALVEKMRREKIVKNYTSRIEPWSSKIYVELFPLAQRKIPVKEVISRLRKQTANIKEAFIYYEEPGETESKEIFVEIYGHDYKVLKQLAILTAQKMEKIKRFTDVKIRMREGRPEMLVKVDRLRAALFNLSTQDIALSLHTQMRGLVAIRYRGKIPAKGLMPTPNKEAKEIETIVRLDKKYRKTMGDVERLTIVSPESKQIYLEQMATFKKDTAPSEIWRKNKARMVQVSANIEDLPLGTAAKITRQALAKLKFPREYYWKFGENYDTMMADQKQLRSAIILSIVLIFMVLASLFESLSKPLVILATVPLAAIGAIFALRLTNKPISTGVLIGGIMLGGIVVNNAIILVDRINFLKRKAEKAKSKYDRRQILIEASNDRLRPIIITSLTTILGLIPMALDKSESSNLWSPLAITVIGGLSFSTFLTLLVIPGIYLIFEDLGIIKER